MSLKRKTLKLTMAFFVVVVFVPISSSPVHAGGRYTKKIDDVIDGASSAGSARHGASATSGVPAPGSRAPSPSPAPSPRSSSTGAGYSSSVASPSSRVPASSPPPPRSSSVGESYSSPASSGGTSGKRKRDEIEPSETKRDYVAPKNKRPKYAKGAKYHIIHGDKNGGGHLYGSKWTDRKKFPKDWDQKRILDGIEAVVLKPKTSMMQSKSRIKKTGTVDGIEIIVIEHKKVGIITGFPKINHYP